MIDFKTHTLFSKIFLSITLFWIYPSLCLASGTGSIYYLDPMPLRPMSIRTGIEPALFTRGENALEEIEPMPHVQNELRHEVQHPAEHKVEQAATPPLPPAHPAPLLTIYTPVPVSAPSPPDPPPEIQVDGTYANSTIQKPNVIMNCLIDDFDMISIAVSNRLSNLFEKKVEAEIVDRKKFWKRFLKEHTKQQDLSKVTIFGNKQQGYINGFDTKLNEKIILGLALFKGISNTDFYGHRKNIQNSQINSLILYNSLTLTDKVMVNSNVQYGESLLQHTIDYQPYISTRSRSKMFKAGIESTNMYTLNRDTIIKLSFRTTYSHFDIYQFYKKNRGIEVFIPRRKTQFLLNTAKLSFKKLLTHQGIIVKPVFYVKAENLVNIKGSSNSIVITQENYGCVENQYLLRKKPRLNLGINLSILYGKTIRFKIRGNYGFGRKVESQNISMSFLYNL
ncbi:MAG: autotransporter domain-containing protein [Rickettsiaceae bacterium]|nr:autotransporter domain-containing protein [Rickettsiaceae bacterium]